MSSPQTAGPPAPIPVVLLHGALRGRLGMVPTMVYLQQHGIQARPFGYPTRSAPVEEHAAALEAFLDDWLGAQAPVPLLGLLTHSMGGLVARAYLGRPASQRHAARVRLVQLAPPNQGAQLAAPHAGWAPFSWVYGEAAQALLPQHAQRLPLPPAHCEVLILAGGRGRPEGINPRIQGDDDGLVAVTDTPLPGVEPEFVGGIHSLMQWRPDVLQRAVRFFHDGPAPALPPPDAPSA